MLSAALLAACAPVPRPSILADVARVREGAAATEAKSYAPAAFAHAEKLHREADAAFAGGDIAGAGLLGERAIAAYQHAHALARVARAEQGATGSDAELTAANAELASIEADLKAAIADADALELRVRVARDAQPIQASGRADPAREKARVAAARALALQAGLLCGAARLLHGQPGRKPADDEKLKAQLDEAAAALAKVDGELSAAAVPVAPIDGASRARAACLAALTSIRRADTPVGRAPGAGDALLAEISATGHFAPSRDDRGVFVTLRGVLAGDKIAPAAEARLAELGRIAAAHPAFPIQVVLHDDRPAGDRDAAARKARAEVVAKAIAKTGQVKTLPVLAGNAAPLVDAAGGDRARNARIEIVFVTPEAF